MVRLLGHRQTKGAATDKPDLTPPRHISTLPRLCENSPNFVDDGTALHIGYNGASDEILISHFYIGKSREPVQFTTGFRDFTFSHSLGRELPVEC